jgi:hypothetical protein
MITAKYILKLLDAGGPDAFEHMDFKEHPWTEFDYIALMLINDIYEYIQMKERLQASIDYARTAATND